MSNRHQQTIDGTSTRFRAADETRPLREVLPREAFPRPAEWAVAKVITRTLLDKVHARLVGRPDDTGAAMFDLQSGLLEVKSICTPDDWEQVVAECAAHPVCQLLWQDPFTRHSYVKPCGYAGDARLLDYLYGIAAPPPGTTRLGASVFGHMMAQQGGLGVRARGDILARAVDEAADTFSSPRILSIACGHLREGSRSSALWGGRVGELVALDQDADSLAEVSRAYAGTPVRTVNCSVRAILAGKVRFEGFHFVYAAGLYDYLSERVATRLTRLMFDMLAPGGRLLVANFAPGLPEVGYMETFMGWKLIYRTPQEMGRLSADIPGSAWASNRLFWDESGNIIFLDLVNRAARTNAQSSAVVGRPPLSAPALTVPGAVAGAVLGAVPGAVLGAVPGLDRVTFGPSVLKPRPVGGVQAV